MAQGPKRTACHKNGADTAMLAHELGDLLMELCHAVGSLEGSLLSERSDLSLSTRDARAIAIVGGATIREHRTLGISELAEACEVSAPSATCMARRLVDKGLLVREQDVLDARRVNLHLTRRGERVYRVHVPFRMNMVRRIAQGMNSVERAALLTGVRRMAGYYHGIEVGHA